MKRVLLGMSGGVDSSTAAVLLKKEGYEVVGVTMVLFESNKEEGCTSSSAVEDAASVCNQLGIEHHAVDFKKEFKDNVIDDFVANYKRGNTPNPCIVCNRELKFGCLWELAKKLNCDYIATGHYADIKDGHLAKLDSNKDQSYFLYRIRKEVVPHILFPLNKFKSKDEIRAIAKEAGLKVASKKDSQDICFIPSNDYGSFLEKVLDKLPDKGDFIYNNKVIGKHKGIIYYTIGQRKGLGISYEYPLYVTNIDVANNIVYLGKEEDLYKKEIIIKNINLLMDLPVRATAKIRFKSSLEPCSLEQIDEDTIKVVFDNPVKSPTSGQSLVIYDGDYVVGGGIINN